MSTKTNNESGVNIFAAASKAVIFKGVSTIVDNAVKKVTPKETKLHKKILTKIGAIAVSIAVTHVVCKQVEEVFDEIVDVKDTVDEIKEEAIKTATEEAKKNQNETIKIVRKLRDNGMTYKEIADKLGYSELKVSRLMKEEQDE